MLKPLLCTIFLLLLVASNANSTRAGSIFVPDKDPVYCPTDFSKVANGMDVRQYPGKLPDRLDQDFSKYRDIYQGDIDNFMHAYADYMMMLLASATWSKEAAEQLRREIVSNANREPLKYNPRAEGRPTFHVILAMVPITVAYAQHKNEYTAAEQKAVDKWIGKKLNTILRDSYLGSVDTDNKKYLIGVWLAAFGHATSDKSFTTKAIAIYKRAIDKQRKDGSLKNDSQRGGSAIHYSNQATAGLVTLAEMLTETGFDAYAYEKKGRSIHTIIKFLLDATENPKLIAGYASDPEWSKSSFPGYSADHQALDWMNNMNSVWGYYYLNRFGSSELSQRLLKVSPFLRRGQIGVNANAAGNPSCYLGRSPS